MKEQTVTARQGMNEEWRAEVEQTILAVSNSQKWCVGKDAASVDLQWKSS